MVTSTFKYICLRFFPGMKISGTIYCFIIMERLTVLERFEIIKKVYQSGGSVVCAHCLFRVVVRELGHHHRFSIKVAVVVRFNIYKFVFFETTSKSRSTKVYKVQADKLQTLEYLEKNICQFIAGIMQLADRKTDRQTE